MVNGSNMFSANKCITVCTTHFISFMRWFILFISISYYSVMSANPTSTCSHPLLTSSSSYFCLHLSPIFSNERSRCYSISQNIKKVIDTTKPWPGWSSYRKPPSHLSPHMHLSYKWSRNETNVMYIIVHWIKLEFMLYNICYWLLKKINLLEIVSSNPSNTKAIHGLCTMGGRDSILSLFPAFHNDTSQS